MQPIKIGFVEDEMVIAMTIASTLKKLNYNIAFQASNYTDTITKIQNESPDLLLLDINLGGQKDGIDVAEYVRIHYNIPIIFLTANSDLATVQRAKLVKPNAYLLKPFTKDDLFIAIEIAIHNYNENRPNVIENDHLIVKSGNEYFNLKFSHLVFIESNENYIKINLLSGKTVIIRSTLSEIQEKLPSSSFLRINRSVIVHIAFINKIETDRIHVSDYQFNISPKVKKELLEMM
ncbi:MAG: response regulator [Chitinophagaceae bacterium]|nr:response regulator [Chitinophagaceae bacterium]